MTIERKVGMGIAGQPTGPAADVAEVFSTYLYTGTGSSGQNIVNGIDLATEGGMVWCKSRGTTDAHCIYDTERGAGKVLFSNSTGVQLTNTGTKLDFNTNGFFTGGNYGGSENDTGQNIVSWAFRKKEKFFDVVTYTGDDTTNRMINHNLGSTPGCIIVKAANYDGGAPWSVYHTSLGRTKGLNLNNTSAATTDSGYWYNQNPTDTQFGVGSDSGTNGTGYTYVAYLFADNSSEDADDQMIKCGSYTGNGSATGPVVNLGWEPQFLMIKGTGSSFWWIYDTMRGLVVGGADSELSPNHSGAESSLSNATAIDILANGFKLTTTSAEYNGSGTDYIYMAIRAPMMKKPTAATDVFKPHTQASGSAWSVGFPTDLWIGKERNRVYGGFFSDRLRGGTKYIKSHSTAVEATDGGGITVFDLQDSFSQGASSQSQINYNFKRAKGFFDVMAYEGNYSANPQMLHNLGVAPEMLIARSRDAVGQWYIKHTGMAANREIYFNSNASSIGSSWTTTNTYWQYQSAQYPYDSHIAYLFASLAGVSKVGSYTGNGSNQTISCGFSAGSRFILIKRTDAVGDWYFWDSARGIVAGNDGHLSFNTETAEVTSDDSVDPHNSGFIVNQVSATNINVSSGTYIFYAIA